MWGIFISYVKEEHEVNIIKQSKCQWTMTSAEVVGIFYHINHHYCTYVAANNCFLYLYLYENNDFFGFLHTFIEKCLNRF